MDEQDNGLTKQVWLNGNGRHGCWATVVDGVSLRINYCPTDLSGQGRHYRIDTRYSSAMFEHQFYSSLKEAQQESIRMLKEHLEIRRLQGYKG